MRKIVINTCYGGFGLSDKALNQYAKLKNLNPKQIDQDEIVRHDSDLVNIVHNLRSEANAKFSELQIIEIDDNDRYVINDYDGWESLELESQCHNKDWK